MQAWFLKAWASLLTGVIAGLVGFGGGVAFEHRAAWDHPIGRFLGQSLAAQRDQWRDIAATNKQAAEGWRTTAQACDRRRLAELARAKGGVEADSARADARAGSAFDNGYAAGRLAGRKSCGAPTHAEPLAPAPGAAPGPGAGLVRDDLADRFGAAAYRPR